MMRRTYKRALALCLACVLALLPVLPAAAAGETERYDHVAALEPMIRYIGGGLAGLADGDVVEKWLDTSGHSVHAIKVPDVKTGAGTGKPFSKPTVKKDALNGHDAVVFDRAASAALVLPGAGFGGKKQYTIVSVYRSGTTSADTDPVENSKVLDQFVLRQRMGCGIGTGVLQSFAGYTPEKGFAYGACAAKTAAGGWGGMNSGKYADTGYHIQMAVYNSETGLLTCYVDGDAVGSRQLEPFQVSGADATDYVWIGNDWRGNAGLNGEIAELTVFDRAFDEAEVDRLGTALALEYGLSWKVTSGAALPCSLIGVQDRTLDGKLDVRFVLAVDSVRFRSVGVTVTRDGGSAEILRAKTVYPKIVSGDGTLSAEELGTTYLGAIPLTGLPTSGNVTLTVTPLYERTDGKAVKGYTYTVTYTDGAFVSVVKGAAE